MARLPRLLETARRVISSGLVLDARSTLAFDPRVRIRVRRPYTPFEELAMSSKNRITDNFATVAGPAPSSNGVHPNSAPASVAADPAHAPDHKSPNPSAPTDRPSSGENGRDELGRFTPGSGGGPGNPFARLVAELRKAAIEAVPKEKLRAIFVKISDLALEGNVQAAKFIASYLIGKPQPAREPDRADLEEWQQFKEEAPMMREVMQHAKTPDAILPLECARSLRYATTMHQGGMLSAALEMGPAKYDRLVELAAGDPYEVCNLLRDKAGLPRKQPLTNGKRKHRK
jgi:hypothetical protein